MQLAFSGDFGSPLRVRNCKGNHIFIQCWYFFHLRTDSISWWFIRVLAALVSKRWWRPSVPEVCGFRRFGVDGPGEALTDSVYRLSILGTRVCAAEEPIDLNEVLDLASQFFVIGLEDIQGVSQLLHLALWTSITELTHPLLIPHQIWQEENYYSVFQWNKSSNIVEVSHGALFSLEFFPQWYDHKSTNIPLPTYCDGQ